MNRRLAWTLALVVTCGASAARGQQYGTPAAPGPANYAAAQAPAVQQASATEATDDNAKLVAEVAELSKQVKELKDQSVAAKLKAAGMPTAVVGGLIQFDVANYSQNAASVNQFGPVLSSDDFRRARMRVTGEGFNIMDYCIEMEFASLLTNSGVTYGKIAGVDVVPPPWGNQGTWTTTYVSGSGTSAVYKTTLVPGKLSTLNPYVQQVDFLDVYIGLHSLPLVGNFKIGHFKEPFGLEQLTSDRFGNFMERSMGDQGCLVPARQNGAMIYDWTENERATWALGVFKQNDYSPPDFINQGGGSSITGRATWLPWYDEATEGRGLLHLGIAGSYRSVGSNYTNVETPDGNNAILNPFNISARPEASYAPKVVGLNLGDVDDWKLYGTEFAYVYGPLSFQAEAFVGDLHLTDVKNDAWINAGYAYVSYFLTGENRVYDKQSGSFGRVKPYENFFRVRDEDGCIQTGLGAWEILYRYSWVNLNSNEITQGKSYGYQSSTNSYGLGANANGGTAVDNTIGLNWYLNPYAKVMFNYVLSADTPVSQAAASKGVESYMSTFEMRTQIDF
jgi:phosphate-selective porin OprO/OprP